MKKRLLGVVLPAVVAACSSTVTDWKVARMEDTVASYQAYLRQHPSSTYTPEVITRLHALNDRAAWSTARHINTTEGYLDYLQSEPDGNHRQDALAAVGVMERAAAWETAETQATPASLRDFLQKYPTGPEAGAARSRLTALKAYTIQLGSRRSEEQALSLREQLVASYGSELHGVIVTPPSPIDASYVLYSSPMNEQEARGACSTLKRHSQPCAVAMLSPLSSGVASR